jgi:hypothetical protein
VFFGIRDFDHFCTRSKRADSEVEPSELCHVQPIAPESKALALTGESLDREIDRWVSESAMGYYLVAVMLCTVAAVEWYGTLTHSPRRPLLFSTMAGIAVIAAVWRIWSIKNKVKNLRLGRDGERCVGQFLERLREDGGQVFHDIPGKNFSLDHVVISPHGVYAIETKTFSKPWPKARITVEGDSLRVAGRIPDRNPIEQASASARWLSSHLEELTGRKFPVRGVVVFPGWFVEQPSERGPVWVLEPKMLPAYIERESVTMTPSDVALASAQLSRYVRAEAEMAS